MSFVNLMASDIWSDSDITTRTEAIITSQWSDQDQTILSRKSIGASLGQYKLTKEDQYALAAFGETSIKVRSEGQDARKDMALLRNVLLIEPLIERLTHDVVIPILDDTKVVLNQNEVYLDILDRELAEATIASATLDTMALVALRAKDKR